MWYDKGFKRKSRVKTRVSSINGSYDRKEKERAIYEEAATSSMVRIFSGVYIIIINKKPYIGSSKNIANRISKHLSNLKSGVHCNVDLQEAYNKYKTFDFRVLEYTKLLFEREQHYIDKYKAKSLGYNINNAHRPSQDKLTLASINYINTRTKNVLYEFSDVPTMSKRLILSKRKAELLRTCIKNKDTNEHIIDDRYSFILHFN